MDYAVKIATSKETETVTVKTFSSGLCLFTVWGAKSDNPPLTWWCCSLFPVSKWLLTVAGLNVTEAPAWGFALREYWWQLSASSAASCFHFLFVFSILKLYDGHSFNAVTPETFDYRFIKMTFCLWMLCQRCSASNTNRSTQAFNSWVKKTIEAQCFYGHSVSEMCLTDCRKLSLTKNQHQMLCWVCFFDKIFFN